MLVYIAVNETETGEKAVMGAFTEREEAWRKVGEYAAENPKEECWIEQFDTEVWQHDTEEEYRMIHRTRVHKENGMKSHVIVFSREEMPLVEELDGWYIICRQDSSFDRDEGMRKNLQILESHLKEKNK